MTEGPPDAAETTGAGRTLLLLVTDDWYVASHRLALVQAAVRDGWRVVVATHVVSHRAVLAAAGADVVAVRWWKVEAGGPSRNAALVLVDIIRVIRRVRPDILHNVALRPVVFGSIAGRLLGVRGVVNAVAGRGFVFVSTSRLAAILRPFMKRALRLALTSGWRWRARTIVQNPDDRAFLVDEGLVGAADVVLIRGAGVDVEAFVPVPPPDGVPVVALPARMLVEKGVREFVDAARMLRAAGVDARFALVGGNAGEGARWAGSRTLAAWVAEGVVEWWGHQADMAAALRRCHVVCLPSYGEGLPKALLEACAAGLPIVTTDVPGCRDVVTEGDNGYLVPVRDATRLASALRPLIEDPALRARMGRRGRERAVAEFSSTRIVAETLAVYAGVIEDAERRSPVPPR